MAIPVDDALVIHRLPTDIHSCERIVGSEKVAVVDELCQHPMLPDFVTSDITKVPGNDIPPRGAMETSIAELQPRASLCMDDRCDRVDEHPWHEILESTRDVRRRIRELGWRNHPLEPVVNFARLDRHAPAALLDSVVLGHVSRWVPKSMSMILTDVRHDYGSCEERRLYRSLARLKGRREIIHVDLSPLANAARIGVYLLPGSPLILDPWTCMEQINDYLEHKAS